MTKHNTYIEDSEIIELSEETASFAVGEMFAEEIQNYASKVSVLDSDFYIMKKKLINIYPKYYKEVCDRASGAKVDSDKYLAIVSYEFREQLIEKCTDIFIKKDDGAILAGHNEDGVYSAKSSSLIKYITEHGWYVDFSCAESLPTTSYLWNSNGLIITMNYVHTRYKKMDEISSWFILRDIVECGSIDEILKKIGMAKTASGFNINVIDTKINKAYSVEYCIDRTNVMEITDKFVHTNHLLRLEDGYYPESSNTFNRFKYCSDHLLSLDKSKLTIGDIKMILEHKNDDYMYTIHLDNGPDGSVTGSLLLFDSDQKIIQIYDYINNKKLTFRL